MLHPGSVTLRAACAGVLAACAAAADAGPRESTVYRLRDSSRFEQGCFPPCLCPILIASPVRGSFVLRHRDSNPLFEVFDVSRVRWRIPLGSPPRLVTGSGEYAIGGEFALEQRLGLDLAVGGDPAQHFDSGRVLGPAPFPRIDISVSLHGGFCYDEVFEIDAEPAVRLGWEDRRLAWSAPDSALAFDVAVGDLGALRRSGGDFSLATRGCLGEDWTGLSIPVEASPEAGDGLWFLVRAAMGDAAQTYDHDEDGQAGPRDPGVDRAPGACLPAQKPEN